MPCTTPPVRRGGSDGGQHQQTSAALPASLCRELPRGSAQSSYGIPPRTRTRRPKSTPQAYRRRSPPPPLYPQRVCFQPPAASPMGQNQQLTERVHRSDEQKVVVFRSVFGPIRGYFAPFLPFFAGLRKAICGGTTPSRSTLTARRQGETQRGSGLNYPSWLTFTCNAAKSTVPSPRAAAISK
jgi:hypothetical protein